MTRAEIFRRRIARSVREGRYVNTLNLRNRVTINFVWYPGAQIIQNSLIDTFVTDTSSGTQRHISYTWKPDGGARLRQNMRSGRVTIPLAPNAAGTLSCFGTSWRISRVGNAVNMEAANTLRGVQRRLDRLGYHLRRANRKNPGIDGSLGKRTEQAILQFQNDYRPTAGAPANANARLKVRGEWTTNTNASYTSNLQRYNNNTAVVPNPSIANSTSLQNSLVSQVGG